MSDKVTFIIENHGDPSVGIAGFTARVTLDDPIGYDKEDIQFMKQMFSDHYDVPVTQVLTEEEWKIHIEEMQKMEAEMERVAEEAARAERELFKHMETCDGCPECDQF